MLFSYQLLAPSTAKCANIKVEPVISSQPVAGVVPIAADSPHIGSAVTIGQTPWWKQYKKNGVFVIDTEHITVKMDNERKKQVASVDVVNLDKEIIFSAKVYHDPKTVENILSGRKRLASIKQVLTIKSYQIYKN